MKRRVLAASLLSVGLLSSDQAPLPSHMAGGEHRPSATVSASPGTSANAAALEQALNLTPERTRELTKAYERAREYWRARGETAVAATDLIFLNGGDVTALITGGQTVACTLGSFSFRVSSLDQSRYCQGGASPNGAMVFTANGINGMPRIDGLDDYVAAHEFGHAEQAHNGAYDNPADVTDPTRQRERELQATCIAGANLATYVAPEGIQNVARYLAALPADQLHGPGPAQAAEFMRGVEGGTC